MIKEQEEFYYFTADRICSVVDNKENKSIEEEKFQDYQCYICYEISQNIQECKSCERIFCNRCIDSMKNLNKNDEIKCPNHCVNWLLEKPHRSIRNFIDNIQFYCKNYEKGCRQQLKINNANQHEKIDCDYNNQQHPNGGQDQTQLKNVENNRLKFTQNINQQENNIDLNKQSANRRQKIFENGTKQKKDLSDNLRQQNQLFNQNNNENVCALSNQNYNYPSLSEINMNQSNKQNNDLMSQNQNKGYPPLLQNQGQQQVPQFQFSQSQNNYQQNQHNMNKQLVQNNIYPPQNSGNIQPLYNSGDIYPQNQNNIQSFNEDNMYPPKNHNLFNPLQNDMQQNQNKDYQQNNYYQGQGLYPQDQFQNKCYPYNPPYQQQNNCCQYPNNNIIANIQSNQVNNIQNSGQNQYFPPLFPQNNQNLNNYNQKFGCDHSSLNKVKSMYSINETCKCGKVIMNDYCYCGDCNKYICPDCMD